MNSGCVGEFVRLQGTKVVRPIHSARDNQTETKITEKLSQACKEEYAEDYHHGQIANMNEICTAGCHLPAQPNYCSRYVPRNISPLARSLSLCSRSEPARLASRCAKKRNRSSTLVPRRRTAVRLRHTRCLCSCRCFSNVSLSSCLSRRTRSLYAS